MIPLRRRLYQSSPGFSPRQLFSALQGLWAEPSPDACFTDTTGTTPAGTTQAIAKITELSAARSIIQPTAANRPTLQVDANGKVLLRHDATDVLAASLPAINVRRNLLTWSEVFSNSAWQKSNVSVGALVPGPLNTSPGTLLVGGTGTGFTYRATISLSQNADHVYTVYLRAGDAQSTVCSVFNAGLAAQLSRCIISWSGSVPSVGTNTGWLATPMLENQGNGWYRFVGRISSGSNTTLNALIYPDGNGTNKNTAAFGVQIELGPVATPYQKVTDWTSEAYASSGSTYFATPQGMSALHDQSISTTYNLPALSTDIYGWVITPERLSAVQESRLTRYFERLAGLAGPDYLTDDTGDILTADDGEQLMLRG
jgi:hypothetical protein